MTRSKQKVFPFMFAIGIAASWIVLAAVVARAIEEGESRKYTTAYKHTDRIVDGFRVDDFTDAPLQIVVMAQINTTPERAFQLVGVELDRWFLAVGNIRFDNTHSANGPNEIGAGSVRSCDLDGDLLVENLPYWQPSRAYAYTIQFDKGTVSMPIDDHLGVFLVESDGQGGSLVTWRQYFNKRFHIMAPFLNYYMRNSLMKKGLGNLIETYGGSFVSPDF